MSDKEYYDVNLAVPVLENEKPIGFDTKNLDPDTDLDDLVFLFQHKDGKIVINLSDMLKCIKLAEENNYTPPLGNVWWIKAHKDDGL